MWAGGAYAGEFIKWVEESFGIDVGIVYKQVYQPALNTPAEAMCRYKHLFVSQ